MGVCRWVGPVRFRRDYHKKGSIPETNLALGASKWLCWIFWHADVGVNVYRSLTFHPGRIQHTIYCR